MVEIIYQVKLSGKPNRDSLKIRITNSKLSAEAWSSNLVGYYDRDEIVQSVLFGWDLGLVGVPTPCDAKKNHTAALDDPPSVLDHINKELSHGCLLGPIDPKSLPFPVFRAPLSTTEKPGSEFDRVITTCKLYLEK